MRAVSTLTVIGSALWLAATSVHAVGFGRVSNPTQLGQPLNFVVAVRLDADEVLPPDCISAEVQSGENKLAPGQVHARLEGPAGSTDRSVRVTTSGLIDEPVVTVSVTLGCTSKLTHRFVAFVDPPVLNIAQTAPQAPTPRPPLASPDAQGEPPATAAVPRADATPAPAPSNRVAAPRSRARTPATAPSNRTTGAARDGVAASPDRRRAAPRPRPPSSARAAPGGPRLQLEATAPIVARSASAPGAAPPPAAAAPASAASAPSSAASAEQLAVERQRIRALEEGLAEMRKSSRATQASLTALQARLNAAEADRYANPLVYALAALSALLALAVAALWWRRSRERESSQWWTGPVPQPAPSSAPLAAPPAPAAAPEAPALESISAPATTADAFAVSTMVEEDEPPRRYPAAGPPRELSVEELIDLEQQAEFFIVLGQDEAAVDLLMSHVHTDGGNSPLPYLKLLEIHRRRDESAAYQRIRERFNHRFNAYAPAWESDPQQGRSLEDYPDTMLRLQRLWASPARVMETLDASLFRRNKSDETFDLPAYRELLFLYSIARDLAEHAGVPTSTGVDLLLPLGEPDDEPVSRLSAMSSAGDFQHSALRTVPLDPGAFGAAPPADAAASPAPRPHDASPPIDSLFLDFDLDAPAPPPPKPEGER